MFQTSINQKGISSIIYQINFYNYFFLRFVAQTLHLPDFTLIVDNMDIITQVGKNYWPIFPFAEPMLCATSVTSVFRHSFEIHTPTLEERKTFQCRNNTKRHHDNTKY